MLGAPGLRGGLEVEVRLGGLACFFERGEVGGIGGLDCGLDGCLFQGT